MVLLPWMDEEEILVKVEVALEDSEMIVEVTVVDTLVELAVTLALTEALRLALALALTLALTLALALALADEEVSLPLVISKGLPHCQTVVLLSRMILKP